MGAEINQNLPDEIGHFGCWMLQMLGSVQFIHEYAGCNVGKSSIVKPFICDMLVFACFNPHLSFGIDVL